MLDNPTVTGGITREAYFVDQNFLDSEVSVKALTETISFLSNSKIIVVSIVIPIYNIEFSQAALVIKHLNNIAIPTLAIEVIFVDDCSIHINEELVSLLTYGVRFKTTLLRRVANGGPASARNSGIKIARGKYIYFVDSDCLVKPDQISRLIVPFFIDKRVTFAGGSQFNQNPVTLFDKWRNFRVQQYPSLITISNSLDIYIMSPCDMANFIVKRDIFIEEDNLFDEKFTFGYEGMDLVLRFKLKGYYGAYVPSFVKNSKSITSTIFISMLENRSRGVDYFLKKHKEYLAHHKKYFLYLYTSSWQKYNNLFPDVIFSKDRRLIFINFIWEVFTSKRYKILEDAYTATKVKNITNKNSQNGINFIGSGYYYDVYEYTDKNKEKMVRKSPRKKIITTLLVLLKFESLYNFFFRLETSRWQQLSKDKRLEGSILPTYIDKNKYIHQPKVETIREILSQTNNTQLFVSYANEIKTIIGNLALCGYYDMSLKILDSYGIYKGKVYLFDFNEISINPKDKKRSLIILRKRSNEVTHQFKEFYRVLLSIL